MKTSIKRYLMTRVVALEIENEKLTNELERLKDLTLRAKINDPNFQKRINQIIVTL